ncbi:hypothetical protein SCALM49S_01887 [Streptomyces californicus]
MTQSLLDLADDNFIREMLRMAPADLNGSELYRAAQQAVLSSDAAAWQAFIHTGADAAYKRDDDARREKVAEANRVLARQILATAEQSPFTPNLVASAKAALAAGDVRVAEFLSESGQKRARRQSLAMRVTTTPESWLTLRHSGAAGQSVAVGPPGARHVQEDVPVRGRPRLGAARRPGRLRSAVVKAVSMTAAAAVLGGLAAPAQTAAPRAGPGVRDVARRPARLGG